MRNTIKQIKESEFNSDTPPLVWAENAIQDLLLGLKKNYALDTLKDMIVKVSQVNLDLSDLSQMMEAGEDQLSEEFERGYASGESDSISLADERLARALDVIEGEDSLEEEFKQKLLRELRS